ncbi:MAG: hypothetical protein M3036_16715, partial [Bifidobacteriales bacterium]|nr:hypothetical protein [Bifidobacteriales bacterium]
RAERIGDRETPSLLANAKSDTRSPTGQRSDEAKETIWRAISICRSLTVNPGSISYAAYFCIKAN